MSVPQAVAASVLTPGLYLLVDLLAGSASPGTGALKVAVMCPKGSAGDLTNNSEVRAGGGEASAAVAYGTGTPGHIAAKAVYDVYPAAEIDFIAPAAGSGSPILDITFTGSPTGNNSIDVDIHGIEFELSWLVGETVDNMRDKLVTAVATRTSQLHVSAASGGSGVTRITGKVAGNISEDIKVKVVLGATQTGTEAVTGAATLTALSGASTDPDFTLALAAIQGEEYHIIVPCLSNQDIANTTGNLKKVVDHINAFNSGLGAMLQQAVVGYTGANSVAVTGAVARNDGVLELINAVNGRGLPCVLAGREAGGRIKAESIDPAANRIGEVLSGYVGSADVIGDKPTLAESEVSLAGGVALVGYNSQQEPIIIRPITTHSQDTAAGADRRLLDVQNVSAAYIIARDLRSALPAEFPQAKVQKDAEPGEDPPPAGVTEERDIRAFIISQMRFWQRRGVVDGASLDTAIEEGTLIVQVNESDATQVDIVLPFKVVQPLAKLGLVVQRQPS